MNKILALLTVLAIALCGMTCFAESAAIETIMNAGTTQAYTDEAVSEEDINTILAAGLATESAINQQPWYFVVVTDSETMDKISGPSFGGAPAGAPAGDMPAAVPAGDMPAGAPAGDAPAAAGVPAAGTTPKASVGSTPVAIVVYKATDSKSPDPSFDCGLAVQNMYIAAASLGYGVKIVSSPTMTLNGDNHDALCEELGVDPSMEALAVLLIGHADTSVDGVSTATTRMDISEKVSYVK